MSLKSLYWRFFAIHLLTGWATALIFSLGVTYILASANPLLLLLSAVIPLIDVILSKRYVHRLQEDTEEWEDEPLAINNNFVLAVSITGFGFGILLHLLSVLAVF